MANLIGDSLSKSNGAVPEFKNKIQNSGHQLESLAQDTGRSAAKAADQMTSGFANAASESMKYSRDYVKANPAKGVAIAAATGLVAGSLLTMMMSGRKN